MLAGNATLVVNHGNYFLAPVGTTPPTDLLNPTGPWENMGHTSLEDIIALSSEGGEATTLGTLQAPQLRMAYSNRSETMRVVLQQFDEILHRRSLSLGALSDAAAARTLFALALSHVDGFSHPAQ